MADKKKRSTGFQERLKKGTVRKEYDKKLKDRASAKKKKEDKEKRLSDARHTANIESAIQRKQIHKTALKEATEQDDWRMKPSSPIGKYMEHYSAKNKLDDIRQREREAKRMANPSYKPMMSTRPDKELGRKSGGYIKKYANGGSVRKVRK